MNKEEQLDRIAKEECGNYLEKYSKNNKYSYFKEVIDVLGIDMEDGYKIAKEKGFIDVDFVKAACVDNDRNFSVFPFLTDSIKKNNFKEVVDSLLQANLEKNSTKQDLLKLRYLNPSEFIKITETSLKSETYLNLQRELRNSQKNKANNSQKIKPQSQSL